MWFICKLRFLWYRRGLLNKKTWTWISSLLLSKKHLYDRFFPSTVFDEISLLIGNGKPWGVPQIILGISQIIYIEVVALCLSHIRSSCKICCLWLSHFGILFKTSPNANVPIIYSCIYASNYYLSTHQSISQLSCIYLSQMCY